MCFRVLHTDSFNLDKLSILLQLFGEHKQSNEATGLQALGLERDNRKLFLSGFLTLFPLANLSTLEASAK